MVDLTSGTAVGTNAQRDGVSASLGLAVVFTATIFLSATLLFSVQPMFTKLILPLLGGSPNVWNTAMVFFQAMLLGGYVYAHLSSKYLPLRWQLASHVAITAMGLFFLPLAIGAGVTPPESDMPTLWLLGLFAATVGLPFFALSANAPLLQSWFSRTSHKDAQDPYFLYAASNAGSLIILLSYPFLIEPVLALGAQTGLWALGYGLLIAALLASGVHALRRPALAKPAERAAERPEDAAPIARSRIAMWTLLAFIPSSLMLGVTTFVSTNLASSPLLWIIPLSLYLLTFVIVFAKRSPVKASMMAPFMPWVALAGVLCVTVLSLPPVLTVTGSLGSVFLLSLYFHARLVEDRPEASHLTLFYIIMSVGGVLGGIFNALVAPLLFVDVLEFGVVLLLGLLLSLPRGGEARNVKAMAGMGTGLVVLFVFGGSLGLSNLFMTLIAAAMLFLLLSEAGYRVSGRLLFAGAAGWFTLQAVTISPLVVMKDRSFFSALTVTEGESNLGETHKFLHGDTLHGLQVRTDAHRRTPTAYYIPTGSFDLVIQATRAVTGGPIRMSMVGLGAGATACYEQAGDDWTYFEIDPAVVSMARDPRYFSFIADCAPEANILIGDARQRLNDVAAGSQDIVMIDAFSSNAIPAHLITREALALYRSRLADPEEGLVFFHTSNRYADVASVAARLAEDAGLSWRYISKAPDEGLGFDEIGATAVGIVVGSDAAMARLDAQSEHFKRFVPSG